MTDFDNAEPGVDPEEEEAAPEESQNRTFMLVAIGLGGLFIVGLICIALYAFFVAPQQKAAREAQVAAINATNTQVAIDAANTANPPTEVVPTSLPLPTFTDTPSVTETPVIPAGGPTEVPTITNTPGPTFTPSRTPTRATVGGTVLAPGGTSVTPTRVVGTATRTPGAVTAAPGGTPLSGIGGGVGVTPTATALPNTGFMDEVGAPGLFIAALALVAVLVLARRLRLQNS